MGADQFVSDWAHQNDGLATREDEQTWVATRRGWEWKADGYTIERFIRPFDNETRFLVWRGNVSVDICMTLAGAKRSALYDLDELRGA